MEFTKRESLDFLTRCRAARIYQVAFPQQRGTGIHQRCAIEMRSVTKQYGPAMEKDQGVLSLRLGLEQ